MAGKDDTFEYGYNHIFIKLFTMDLKEYCEQHLNLTRVKNVSGHFDIPSGYDSWLDYWEKKMGQTAIQCAKVGCKTSNDLEGGHVYKEGDGVNIYLIPICYDHNHYSNVDYFNVP